MNKWTYAFMGTTCSDDDEDEDDDDDDDGLSMVINGYYWILLDVNGY